MCQHPDRIVTYTVGIQPPFTFPTRTTAWVPSGLLGTSLRSYGHSEPLPDRILLLRGALSGEHQAERGPCSEFRANLEQTAVGDGNLLRQVQPQSDAI